MSASRSFLAALSIRLRLPLGCAVLVLVGACGSDKEPEESGGQPGVATSAPPAGANGAVASSGQANNDVSNWMEEEESQPGSGLPVVARPADPDSVIERYQRECGSGAKTAVCRELRLDVEAIFLESLVAVRASSQRVDPRWYRVAAASETPQLACIGITELVWDPKRTAEDDVLIVRALDSPYHAVRGAAARGFNLVPALKELWIRNGGFDFADLSNVCVDNGRDSIPAPKWAGGYPGAQFRPFASNESRRWFTTPDPPEKVVAWFAARGMPARTEQQVAADAHAKYMEEMTRLSSDPNVDNTDQMMQVLMNSAMDSQWSQALRNIEGIGGEVRYVLIGARQAIGIFRDEVYKATSIVAHQPQAPVKTNVTPEDIEKIRRTEEMRQILGY